MLSKYPVRCLPKEPGTEVLVYLADGQSVEAVVTEAKNGELYLGLTSKVVAWSHLREEPEGIMPRQKATSVGGVSIS